MSQPTQEQLKLAIDEDCRPNVFTHPIAQRILTQAIDHGALCPRRASIHPYEHQRLCWHVEAREALIRPSPATELLREFYGPRVLQLWNGSVLISLYPSEDVPYGVIRWEPSDY